MPIKAASDCIVAGYATTFNRPYVLLEKKDSDSLYIVREQIAPGAFNGTDLSNVIMQYDHKGNIFARTSNKTLIVKPDKYGLFIRANLGGTKLGRQIYEEIKGGYITKMSFGFKVGKDTYERIEETDEKTGFVTINVLRTILSISKLYDVSAVSIPANDGTEINAR